MADDEYNPEEEARINQWLAENPQYVAAQAAQKAAADEYQAQLLEARRQATAVAFTQNQAAGGITAPISVPATPVSGPYEAFNAAYRQAFGVDITQEQQSSNEYVQQLSNDLFRLLPPDRVAGFSLDRIALLPNDDIIRLVPQLVEQLPNERLLTFSKTYLDPIITDPVRRADLGLSQASPGAPTTPVPPPGVSPEPTPPPGTTPVEIPATHAWVWEIGASEWAQKLAAGGTPWEQITIQKLRSDMNAVWTARKADPKFAQLYSYAQQYYTRTGYWPTEVELNRFTQNIPTAPNISPDGSSVIPKNIDAQPGDYPPWQVPSGADGKPIPLPPGYEWRFTSDGQPIPFDNDQAHKDLFAGWYQDPKTGSWSYNPFLGAADYLQSSSQEWSDLIGGFVDRTGRLPSLQEARDLSARLWSSGADAATQVRATQFANANGFWPTPFELEFGAAKDADANAASGTAGQAGLGQVPVVVPGVGVVLTNGNALGTGGGFAFDPMQGIPGVVRPWMREILNGRLTLDQIPAEVRDWAIFSLAQFKDQLPQKRRDELGLSSIGSTGQPNAINFGTPGPMALVNKELDQASFLNAWKTYMPAGTPEPTTEQMNSVPFLSQIDSRITQYLPSSTLRLLPLDALAQFSNDVLINRVPDIIPKFPAERLGTFSKDYLNTVITDSVQRSQLGLMEPTTPTAAPPKTPTSTSTTQPVPATQSAQLTPPLIPPPLHNLTTGQGGEQVGEVFDPYELVAPPFIPTPTESDKTRATIGLVAPPVPLGV